VWQAESPTDREILLPPRLSASNRVRTPTWGDQPDCGTSSRFSSPLMITQSPSTSAGNRNRWPRSQTSVKNIVDWFFEAAGELAASTSPNLIACASR